MTAQIFIAGSWRCKKGQGAVLGSYSFAVAWISRNLRFRSGFCFFNVHRESRSNQRSGRMVSSSSSSVEAMMKKAVTESSDFHRNMHSVKGYEQRKEDNKQKRKEKKGTLTQWYGMKRTSMTADQKKDMELLQYRNFVDKDSTHVAPKRTTTDVDTEFIEFGYFAGTGKNKRRRLKSFADEWIEEAPELKSVVNRRVHRNIKGHKKEAEQRQRAAKKALARQNKHKDSKRRKRGGSGEDQFM